MDQLLLYTILGLVVGGVYGIAAAGLVVTYTTSGIFNFAHGATAMLGAFAYWQVRYDWGWPAPLALFAVLGILAPALGIALYVVVMRGLRGTSEVTRIVVPVSVMLGFLALATWVWDPQPDTPRIFSKFFGAENTVRFFGVNLTYHELIALAAAVVIALGLRFLFFATRSGVAMRAVVDDPELLELNGGRPERLAALSWALGSFLAVLAGILITPIQGSVMSATALTLLVIDAFAAAMFGRLRSVPRTFIGALVLGLAWSYIVGYVPTERWTWADNLAVSLPMLALFAVLIVLPQDRLRGATVLRTRERFRLPSVPTAAAWGVVLIVVMYLAREIMAPTAINNLAYGMCAAIVALSLVLLTGYAGEINLAALSFGAIGAIVAYHWGRTGTGFEAYTTIWGYVLAAVVTALVGALVALPALRLRGLYLALATMAFGVFVSLTVLRENTTRKLPIIHTEFTLFPQGNINVPRPKIGPLDLRPMPTFLMAVTVVFAVLGVGLIALRHSSFGRRLTAMKDSPAAAATLGQSMVKLKLAVFMLSAGIAGLGGALLTSQFGTASLERYEIFLSLSLLMLTVVGGIGYVSGALFGGVFFGVAFLAMQNTFDKLGVDHASLEGLFEFFGRLTTVLPALMGVSMGRNPSGAVSQITRDFAPLGKAKPVLLVGLSVELAAYLMAYQDVISNWWFLVITALVIGGMPAAAKALLPEAYGLPARGAETVEVPLELVGVDRPFTEADLEMLDRELGVAEEVAARAPAGG